MRRRPYLRTALEAVSVAVLYFAGLWAMVQWRVMEVILAPGSHSVKPYVALALFFLMLRMLVIFVLPGYILARIYLAAAKAPGGAGNTQGPSSSPLSTTIDLTYTRSPGFCPSFLFCRS